MKHGRWILMCDNDAMQKSGAVSGCECSECGYVRKFGDYYSTDAFVRKYAFKFCPDCGAKMDEVKK